MEESTKDLVAIGTLALLCSLAVLLINGNYNPTFDDVNYLKAAHLIILHQFNLKVILSSPYYFGYALPYTIAISLSLFNSVTLPATLEYIALIILIYLIGLKTTQSRLIAYSTALIALTSGFILLYASRILPDLLASVVIAFAVYISLDNKRRSWFFAGLLFGSLIFIKLSALSFALPFILALFLYKKPILPFLTGLIIIILIYMASIGFTWSIFSEYQANQLSLDASHIWQNIVTLMIFLVPLYYYTYKGVFIQIFGIGMLLDLALIGIYIARLRKDNYYAIWSFILAASLLYMFFGTESFTSYTTITIVSRYMEELAPILAILCAYALKVIFDGLYKRYKPLTAYMILIAIIIISVLVQIPIIWFISTHSLSFIGAPI